MIKEVIGIILCIVAFNFIGYAVHEGIEKQEQVTCEKLERQATLYPNFYYTDYEKEMCEIN